MLNTPKKKKKKVEHNNPAVIKFTLKVCRADMLNLKFSIFFKIFHSLSIPFDVAEQVKH